jgi:release factor glutamine methyltransferase
VSPLAEARAFLRARGVERPDDDVKLLAAAAAGTSLRLALGAPPPDFAPEQADRFRRLVERRGDARVPAAYLVGTEEFCGLELAVSPAVLIPRPSTESLVERAGPGPGRFLEVGTGSGAVAVALAVRGWSGTATDLSRDALEVARANAARHGVASRVAFERADLWPEAPGSFDLVISNPPYVASGEWEGLPPEVRHEPRLALDGGPDGLDVVRRILAGARRFAPRALVEIAPTQADAVRDLALRAGFGRVLIHRDLDGFDRVVEAA